MFTLDLVAMRICTWDAWRFQAGITSKVGRAVNEEKKRHHVGLLPIATEWQRRALLEIGWKLPAVPCLLRMSGEALSAFRVTEVVDLYKDVSAWMVAGSGNGGVLLS